MTHQRVASGQIFPAVLTLEGVKPEMEFEPKVFGPIARSDIVRYAGASGDFNPIHIDEGYAKQTGAPTVFAMGMFPAGYLATALTDWIGGPQYVRRFKVRFTTRVWPGDEIVCNGKVTTIDDARVTVALEARRRGSGPQGSDVAEDEVAIVGEAEIELPR